MLRRWRAEQAEVAGVPRYVVLTNRNVNDLVLARPDSLAALARIPGIGKAKIDQYGQSLLELLRPGRPHLVAPPSASAEEVARS